MDNLTSEENVEREKSLDNPCRAIFYIEYFRKRELKEASKELIYQEKGGTDTLYNEYKNKGI